jgi:hypothetical protein
VYKKASLRTGGSNPAGKERNRSKVRQPNDYRVINRKRTGKGVPSARTILRRQWTHYIEMCVQEGLAATRLPYEIVAEVKRAGGLRKWLVRYARVS